MGSWRYSCCVMSMRHCRWPQRCSGVEAPLPLFTSLLNYRHSPGAGQAPTAAALEAWEGMEWLRGEERTNYPFTLSVDDLGEGFVLTSQVQRGVGAERRSSARVHGGGVGEVFAMARWRARRASCHLVRRLLDVLPEGGASACFMHEWECDVG